MRRRPPSDDSENETPSRCGRHRGSEPDRQLRQRPSFGRTGSALESRRPDNGTESADCILHVVRMRCLTSIRGTMSTESKHAHEQTLSVLRKTHDLFCWIPRNPLKKRWFTNRSENRLAEKRRGFFGSKRPSVGFSLTYSPGRAGYEPGYGRGEENPHEDADFLGFPRGFRI